MACPICLRPRSKDEITESHEELRLQEEKRRKRRLNLIVGLAAGAAIVYGSWHLWHPMFGVYSWAKSKAAHFAEEATNPRNYMVQPPSSMQSARDAQPSPEPARRRIAATPFAGNTPRRTDEATVPSLSFGNAPATAAGSGLNQPDNSALLFNPATHWAVSGKVYDLLTLEPLVKVLIAFKGDNGFTLSTAMTDGTGSYLVVLPRNIEGSFTAETTAPRYARIVLCEPDIPYRELSLEKRRELVNSAQDGDLHRAPFKEIVGESSEQRDLFLALRR